MEKVRLLDTEKMKTEKAFHDFLPKSIIRDLKRKRVRLVCDFLSFKVSYIVLHLQVLAEKFDNVTILFGDVVGFVEITANCTPNELIDFMNSFCASLDTRIAKFNVYNVHTMGEELMVVSGMPNKIGKRDESFFKDAVLMLWLSFQVLNTSQRSLQWHWTCWLALWCSKFRTGPMLGCT